MTHIHAHSRCGRVQGLSLPTVKNIVSVKIKAFSVFRFEIPAFVRQLAKTIQNDTTLELQNMFGLTGRIAVSDGCCEVFCARSARFFSGMATQNTHFFVHFNAKSNLYAAHTVPLSCDVHRAGKPLSGDAPKSHCCQKLKLW